MDNLAFYRVAPHRHGGINNFMGFLEASHGEPLSITFYSIGIMDSPFVEKEMQGSLQAGNLMPRAGHRA
jgi:hypothetical protein